MDRALRVAERRFHESGAVEDEIAWLNQRLRCGELTRERIDLARFCGNLAAARLLGRDCEGEAPCLRCFQEPSVLEWLAVLGGRDARLRGAIAAGRSFLEVWDEGKGAGGDASWPELRPLVVRVLSGAEARALGRPRPTDEEIRAYRMELRHLAARRRQTGFRPVFLAVDAVLPAGMLDWDCLRSHPDKSRLFAAIGREVEAFALGYADPVRRRPA